MVCYAFDCPAKVERGLDSALRSALSVQFFAGLLYPIYSFGQEHFKKRVLQTRLPVNWLACFGLTSPTIGSDPSGMETRRQESRWRAIWSAASQDLDYQLPHADVFRDWAKLDGRVTVFVLERGAKGLHTPKIEWLNSLCAPPKRGSIFMDEVFLP